MANILVFPALDVFVQEEEGSLSLTKLYSVDGVEGRDFSMSDLTN